MAVYRVLAGFTARGGICKAPWNIEVPDELLNECGLFPEASEFADAVKDENHPLWSSTVDRCDFQDQIKERGGRKTLTLFGELILQMKKSVLQLLAWLMHYKLYPTRNYKAICNCLPKLFENPLWAEFCSKMADTMVKYNADQAAKEQLEAARASGDLLSLFSGLDPESQKQLLEELKDLRLEIAQETAQVLESLGTGSARLEKAIADLKDSMDARFDGLRNLLNTDSGEAAAFSRFQVNPQSQQMQNLLREEIGLDMGEDPLVVLGNANSVPVVGGPPVAVQDGPDAGLQFEIGVVVKELVEGTEVEQFQKLGCIRYSRLYKPRADRKQDEDNFPQVDLPDVSVLQTPSKYTNVLELLDIEIEALPLAERTGKTKLQLVHIVCDSIQKGGRWRMGGKFSLSQMAKQSLTALGTSKYQKFGVDGKDDDDVVFIRADY
ncbi:hypothetical protein BDR26DRAFT_895596 [Obelidium mucronatum]|nr:hypothetical protein BDR26DRAFT_895596 [Obelidium mucronatum]